MKKAFLVAKQRIEVRDVDVPELGPTGIKLRPAQCGICGSEIQAYKLGYHASTGSLPYPEDILLKRYGDKLGHEASGTVVETGPEVKNWKVGDRYRSNDIEGSFAEYVVIPAEATLGKLHHLPDELSFEQGALIEPARVAVFAISKTDIKPGETVAILGGGGIGLLALQVCKTLGAGAVYVSEINSMRIEKAKILGADEVINPAEVDVVERVKQLTDQGVDIVIETAGIQQTFDQMLSILKVHGRGVLISWWENPVTVDLNKVVGKSLRLNGLKGPTGPQWRWVQENCRPETLMKEGKLDIDPIITSTVPLEQIDAAFRATLEGRELKVLVHP